MASGSDSPAATISSDSPSEPQAEGPASSRPESVENIKRTVRVLLPLPLADAYDYSVPGRPGGCRRPLRDRAAGQARDHRRGVGRGHGRGRGRQAARHRGVLPALPMADALRRFVDWVAAYTLAPPGAVLRMAMSVPSALEAPKTEIVYRPPAMPATTPLKLTAARRRVLEQLKDGPAMPAAELAHLAGVGTSVIKTMASIGLLEARRAHVRRSLRAARRPRAGARPVARAGDRRARPGRQGAGARFLGDAARRRARRRQDRGLFRGHRRRAGDRAGRCWCCCPRSR